MSLRTVSLRRRVTFSAIGVLGVVLVGLVFLVDAMFGAQTHRDIEGALTEKYRTAQNLFAKEPQLRGQELVSRLQGRGVQAYVEMPDGATFGLPPDAGVAHRLKREMPDGSQLTLYGEPAVISEAQARLRRLLLLVGFGALAVTALALVWVVRRALAPLDAMTSLARSIANGDRGHRLNPSRTDNELGRTAAAFDDMLDSLEGSEERTKRFVADAAHELRTPITGVQAVSEALMHTGSAEERERLNLLLVRECRRAGRLVDDLLALARIDAGLELYRERVDLLALAEAEVGRTRLLAPDFHITASGSSALVWGDPQRLAQVLANLADNARQATGPSGIVRIHVSTAGSYALLTVTDNGPGVPPEHRERIFDRLVRLDEARDRRSGGSGLGLPIARGVVRAHGGELSCLSPDARLPTFAPTSQPISTSHHMAAAIPTATTNPATAGTAGTAGTAAEGGADPHANNAHISADNTGTGTGSAANTGTGGSSASPSSGTDSSGSARSGTSSGGGSTTSGGGTAGTGGAVTSTGDPSGAGVDTPDGGSVSAAGGLPGAGAAVGLPGAGVGGGLAGVGGGLAGAGAGGGLAGVGTRGGAVFLLRLPLAD